MTWQKKAQFVTVTQAMQKLEKFCTYQERSQKQVYEKPSAKKRRKKKEGIANFKKKQKKLKMIRGY